ncbi:MAG: Kiwa anti-phage protein KwaB-like domain-containing protein [Ktedonobacterales bacterium]
MTSDEHESHIVLDRLVNMDIAGDTIRVCIASCVAGDDVPIFQRIPVTEHLSDAFRTVVTDALQRWRKERQEQQLVLWPHLDGTRPESHEFEYLDLTMHESIRKQVEALARPGQSPIDLPVFCADDDVVAGIRFYSIAVERRDETVYFFRTYTPKRELSRSSWFAAWLNNGQFDTINTPTFLFDDGIDCFCVGSHMFIVQKTNFQAIFRFFEMVARAASQTLSIIQTHIPIKNFDNFAEDCQGHLQKLAKLKNIAQQPYLNTITMDDLCAVIDEAQLHIPVEQVNGTRMLVYDRADRWAILRLLDNHYMQSLLTKGLYDASDKRPLLIEGRDG